MSQKNKMVSKAIEDRDFTVVVRCRPPRYKEPEQLAVSIDLGTEEITLKDLDAKDESAAPKTFCFDRVFNSLASQQTIFDDVVRPLIQRVLEGYNGTILAYGEQGAGKTYTMTGNLYASKEDHGLVPRAIEEIFRGIENTKSKQYLVYCSFLLIYSEQITDLLSNEKRQRLILRERTDGNVFALGSTSWHVKNSEELMGKYLQGLRQQQVLATNMSVPSSRVFSIFAIRFESFELDASGKVSACVNNLIFVDCAASTRPTKSGITDSRIQEARNIAKSVSTFGVVISALTDPKGKHIPYRDSKFTYLLKNSLGGNTKTILIANIRPDGTCYNETLNTLRLATRARLIKNIAKINYRDSILQDIQAELNLLKRQLNFAQTGLDNQPMLLNQENEPNQNGNEIEEEKDYTKREKKHIESLIEATMRQVARIEEIVDERKSEAYKLLREKAKECEKVIEHRVMLEAFIESLKNQKPSIG